MWEDIVTYFAKESLCDVSSHYLTLTTSKIRKDETLTKFSVLFTTAAQKVELGAPVAEFQLQALFLQGLSEEFDSVKSLIRSRDPDISGTFDFRQTSVSTE